MGAHRFDRQTVDGRRPAISESRRDATEERGLAVRVLQRSPVDRCEVAEETKVVALRQSPTEPFHS